jgi:hypothetical protein
MAGKNHVRALVHATGTTMSWAISYYKGYRFEISQNPEDDMILEGVIDLSTGNAIVTFQDVLQAILDAANAGYSEVMIVAHGSSKGLLAPMAPGLGSADKDGLPFMTKLADVVAERDRILKIVDSKQQLTEWLALLRRVAGKPIGSAIWGPIRSDEFDNIKSAADAQRKLMDTAPTMKGHKVLNHPGVLKLLDLRNQVVRKELKRVEVRACNLGQDVDGMAALRAFLGAARVLAPMVKTFYGQVTPRLFTDEAQYRNWLAAHVSWLAQGRPDPPHARTYTGDFLYLQSKDKNTTPLSVLKLWQPNFQTCAAIAGKPGNYAMIQTLVEDNIDVKKMAGYRSGPFFIGGLDAEQGRTNQNPPPAEAHGKAFLVASEPEYRQMIVSNP